MIESLGDIRRRLVAGEDSLTEFTEVRFGGTEIRDAEDLADELCAFANATGGLSSSA